MARYTGIYRGICVSKDDPLGRSRLQVKVPEILGENPTWARGCVWPTPAGGAVLPAVGSTVWIMFEGGGASRPVWIRFEQRVPPTINSFGIYGGVCVNTQDPTGKSRIQVKLPTVLGDKTTWASSVLGPTFPPSVGDTVWIIFEENDPQYALWLGVEP